RLQRLPVLRRDVAARRDPDELPVLDQASQAPVVHHSLQLTSTVDGDRMLGRCAHTETVSSTRRIPRRGLRLCGHPDRPRTLCRTTPPTRTAFPCSRCRKLLALRRPTQLEQRTAARA